MLDLPHWFETHGEWVALSAGLSFLMLVASAAGLPFIVSRLPADYFVRSRKERRRTSRHPFLSLAITVTRNTIGTLVILAGIAMLVLPGQGLLTILAGVLLADVPGKRRLALWLLRRPGVHKAADWLRERAGRPPLELPPHGTGPASEHPSGG